MSKYKKKPADQMANLTIEDMAEPVKIKAAEWYQRRLDQLREEYQEDTERAYTEYLERKALEAPGEVKT